MRILCKAFILAFGLLFIGQFPAKAEYPERPIRMIIAYDIGGSTDALARMLVPYLQKYLGGASRVTIFSRPGAGGENGFSMLAQSLPDGYTIGFINSPNVLTIPIQRPARYGLDQLDPLVNIVDDPGVWVVPQDSRFQTVQDVVTYAAANPQSVTVGSTGLGSDDHLAMLLLQQQAQIRLAHVPFAGSGTNVNAMLNRKILIGGSNVSEAIRLGERGRILGVMSERRSDIIPDIPTFKEQGFPVMMSSMRGLAAPAGLPKAIRSKLVDAVTKAVRDPEFVAKASAQSTYQSLRILGPDVYAKELDRMNAEYRLLWQQTPWAE